MSAINYDNVSSNSDSRFLELHEELRHTVFTSLESLSPSSLYKEIHQDPWIPTSPQNCLDASAVSIPQNRLIAYLQNWVVQCAPHLDKFDEDSHFQNEIPLLARGSPAMMNAMLAFSARQMERTHPSRRSLDSLELYQESIRLLASGLQAKDPKVLVTACILAVFELMGGSPQDWRRHLEGCASLFAFFRVNGFSDPLSRAVFWVYARMELCGAIISEGTETTMLPLEKWVPHEKELANQTAAARELEVRKLFEEKNVPETHACWAVYLCTKVCHLQYKWTRHHELGEVDEEDDRPFPERWTQLWNELELWLKGRPDVMKPVIDLEAANDQVFPTIFFSHVAAISSNQLYHTACILMLEMMPTKQPGPRYSPVWHARRVCGISCTNPHGGSRVNAIQPLYVAGKLFTYPAEHSEIARLLSSIDKSTGWGALWRLKDLEAEWGYNEGEILNSL